MARKEPKRYRVRVRFPAGDEFLSLAEVELQLMYQHFKMAASDDPRLRDKGRAYLEDVAKHAVSSRIAKRLTSKTAAVKSVKVRQSKNASVDQRIYAAHDHGESNKAIALKERLSESTISRKLKKRP
jgi:hypothetical protein